MSALTVVLMAIYPHPLVQGVGNVTIPKQGLLPSLQRRNRVRQESETVVWRQHGYSQHVPHSYQHEKVLHMHPQPQGVGHHAMQSHPIEETLRRLRNLTLLLRILRFLDLLCHLTPRREYDQIAK